MSRSVVVGGVGGLAVTTLSNLNSSCIELELGLGFDKSEIKATSAQLELELWLSLGITGL